MTMSVLLGILSHEMRRLPEPFEYRHSVRRPYTMKILEECRLVDVLGEWGIHEGEGRLQLPTGTFSGDDRILSGVEVALTRRAPLVWCILAGWPMAALRIEITPEDIAILWI